MKKKILSLILATLMCVSLITPAYAEANQKIDPVLLNTYSASHYDVAAYQADDTIYVITLLSDGRIELAYAEAGSSARTIWLNINDLSTSADNYSLQEISFVNSIIAFGMANKESSTAANIIVGSYEISAEGSNADSSVPTRGANADDRSALISLLRARYGFQHTNYCWTQSSSQTIDGLTYKFRENLTYDMVYRNFAQFSANATLGSIFASLLSRIPGLKTTLSAIASLLDVASDTVTIVDSAGEIANYHGSVVYCRFVMINDQGPYYQCYQTIDYNGWVHDDDVTKTYSLEHIETRYSATSQIFQSHALQRVLAYENYS